MNPGGALALALALIGLARRQGAPQGGAPGVRRQGAPQGGAPGLRGDADPRGYARSHVGLLRRRWSDPSVRAILARVAEPGGLLPGAPAAALLGLTVTSAGPTERGGPPDFVRGWWNVTRAYRDAHRADPETLGALGRAIPAGDGLAWMLDTEGQGYLGARQQRDAWRSVETHLPPELHDTPGSAWALRLGAAAYSSGPAPVIALARHYATALAPVAGPDRWRVLRELVARDCRAPSELVAGVRCGGRWHAAHLLLRSDERAESANAIAHEIDPSAVGYLGSQLTDADTPTVERLRRLARG